VTLPDLVGGPADHTTASDPALLALFDMLGRRWALRVIWELRAEALTYRDLAARIPGMSTSVLTQRLRDLRTVRLVEHARGSGYQLSSDGADLLPHLIGLRDWATQVHFGADHKPP
jgi:DNA-binding HxlR family transcriptional regulator